MTLAGLSSSAGDTVVVAMTGAQRRTLCRAPLAGTLPHWSHDPSVR